MKSVYDFKDGWPLDKKIPRWVVVVLVVAAVRCSPAVLRDHDLRISLNRAEHRFRILGGWGWSILTAAANKKKNGSVLSGTSGILPVCL